MPVSPTTMLIWFSLDFAFAILVAATLFGFLGRYWWVFELFSHFRVQYFFATLIIAVTFFLVRKPVAGLVGCGFALLNLVVILPLYFGEKKKKTAGESYKLLLANVNTANLYHDKVRRLIEDVSPDLLVLVEVDQGWVDGLGLKEIGYPFCAAEPRGDNYGIALYSRLPLDTCDVVRFGSLEMPSVFASLHLGGSIVNVIGSHPPPPKSCQLASYRDQQIGDIMDFANSLEGGVIFCGDLNMTSWSPAFRYYQAQGELGDTRCGYGVQPTWPTWMPLLLVPLDHIWVSKEIQVHNREIGPRIGSDHRPVILVFSLLNRE